MTSRLVFKQNHGVGMQRILLFVLVVILSGCAGNRNTNTQDLDRVVRELQLAAKMDPGNPVNFITIGDAYLKAEKYDSALVQYNKALQIKPGLNEALMQKGTALWALNRTKEAAKIFRSILYSEKGNVYVAKIGKVIGCPYKITRVSDDHGSNAFPGPSPLGEKLLFQSNRDGDWDIYIMNSDGNGVRQLTNNKARDEAPVFSPDGYTFAFTSTRNDTIHTHLDDVTREIYLGNINNGNVVRLTHNNSDDWAPLFSRDGKKLFFLSDRNDPRNVPAHEKTNDIFMADLETKQVIAVTDFPGKKGLGGLDADGKHLFFSLKVNEKYDIYVKNMHREAQRKFFGTDGDDAGVKLSHNGHKLVFFSNANGNFDIYLVNMKDRNPVRLTCDAALDAYPVFSANDKKIYFHSNREGTFQIYAVDLTNFVEKDELNKLLTGISKSTETK